MKHLKPYREFVLLVTPEAWVRRRDRLAALMAHCVVRGWMERCLHFRHRALQHGTIFYGCVEILLRGKLRDAWEQRMRQFKQDALRLGQE